MAKATVLDALYYLAESRDGYFTTRQAGKLGITRTAVAKAEQRGRLERVSRGVYRLTHFPRSPMARYWEAILWPQARAEVNAVLSDATALRLHELCDAHPSTVHITLPASFHLRRRPPPWLIVRRADLAGEEVAVVNGLPVTTVARTLRDVAENGGPKAS